MSNETKQTPVEWFLDQLIEHRIIIVDKTTYQVKYKHQILLEQAKEMDKERLTDAYCDGKANGMDISHPLSLTKEISANEWYEQTYGGNK
jgi:hypothetical protein